MNLGKLIAKGNTADIYAIDNQKVVKLFKPHFPGVEAEKEASKQRFAKKCGLHVPKVFDVTVIPYLCHGDFHPFNVLMDEKNDETIIIDWVDASAGDIRADVYRTYLLLSGSSQSLADLYMNLYCSTSEITQDDIFQWAQIIAGARLFELVPFESKQRLINIVNELYR